MSWLQPFIDWAKSHDDALLTWLGIASLAMFLLTPVAVMWAVVRTPTDYFLEREHRPLQSWDEYPILRVVALVAKNLLGVVLLVAGVAMLLLPGQGLLTIAVALMLIDFPGKHRLERWFVTRPAVWRSINWARRRAGREPLKQPPGGTP